MTFRQQAELEEMRAEFKERECGVALKELHSRVKQQWKDAKAKRTRQLAELEEMRAELKELKERECGVELKELHSRVEQKWKDAKEEDEHIDEQLANINWCLGD